MLAKGCFHCSVLCFVLTTILRLQLFLRLKATCSPRERLCGRVTPVLVSAEESFVKGKGDWGLGA